MTLALQLPLPAASAGPAADPLAAWAGTHRRRIGDAAIEGLRFAFY